MFGRRRRKPEEPTPSSSPILDLIRNELVPMLPPRGPQRANVLMNIGSGLLMAGYEQDHDPAILDAAIDYCRQGVAATPASSRSDLAYRLMILGDVVGTRYAATWDPADLDEVVASYRKSLDLTPAGTPARATMTTRLDAALAIRRKAPDDPAEAVGNAAGSRFSETGDIAELDRAVDAYRRALGNTSKGDPQRVTRLQTLGRTLAIRAGLNESVADLDQAVTYFRTAIGIASAAQRPDLSGDLGRILTDRYVRTDHRADLDEAVKC
jgi:hypothetical protein